MANLSWPASLVLVMAVLCVTALGLAHVVGADWIEHSITAAVGIVVGHAIGLARGRAEP